MHSLLCKSMRHLGAGAGCKKAATGAVPEGLISKTDNWDMLDLFCAGHVLSSTRVICKKCGCPVDLICVHDFEGRHNRHLIDNQSTALALGHSIQPIRSLQSMQS